VKKVTNQGSCLITLKNGEKHPRFASETGMLRKPVMPDVSVMMVC